MKKRNDFRAIFLCNIWEEVIENISGSWEIENVIVVVDVNKME